MDGYFRVLADDFVLFVDVGGGEVDHDIHDKHDVDCKRKQINSSFIRGDDARSVL